ncbi:MAG TPA: LysR family transcriptional regulator [Acetobacteraceae bacterium]|jgi:DNA-binding transcriptional LysR family regulator|nr:LysR family transcriptional regulator [Acetobacteraceae bacterium]
MAPSFSQFRYFCAVAECGHFGQAAAKLNISQPPLSRQIAALEEELGTKLLERSRKGAELTPAGRQFYADAQAVLRLVQQAQRNVTAAGWGQLGDLSLGFMMCAAHSIVPALTRLYVSAFPKVRLRVRELMPTAVERELKDGLIDFGITLPGLDAPDVQATTLLHETMSLVVAQDHPLARKRRVDVADLANETFLIVPHEHAPSLYDGIIRRCQLAGFTPRIGLEAHLQQTLVSFVAEGLGVAFVPASMRRAHVQGTVFKSVTEPPTLDVLLVWKSANKNPCMRGMIDAARNLSALLSPRRNRTGNATSGTAPASRHHP